jgi:hypothetical protein
MLKIIGWIEEALSSQPRDSSSENPQFSSLDQGAHLGAAAECDGLDRHKCRHQQSEALAGLVASNHA